MPNSAYHRAFRQEISSMVDQLDLPELHKQAIRSRWLDQVLWMDQKADQCRRWHYRLRLTTIVGGVILPALVGLTFQVQNNPSLKTWLPIATFGLSQVIAVSAAMEEFCRFGDRWRQYRQTVESLKTEGWQFLQTSGAYAQHENHVAGYPLFAARVESIITDDVKTYITEMVKQKVKEEEVVQQGAAAARQAAQRITSSNLLAADRPQAAEFSTGMIRSSGPHSSAAAPTLARSNGSGATQSSAYPAGAITASYVPDFGTDRSLAPSSAGPVGLMTAAPVVMPNAYATASYMPIQAMTRTIKPVETVATPSGITLQILSDTILKSLPQPSEQLTDSEKVLVKGGSVYALQACVLGENNHYCVTFSEVGFGSNSQTTWYVYAPHVNVAGKAVGQNNLQRLLEITGKNQDKIRLNVPFFQQVDNLYEPYRTCNTSSCAMVAKFLGAKIGSDDDYYQIVQKYGDTTDHNAQTQALAELEIQSTWHTNLDYDDLDRSLAAGLPIVIGILHRGSLEQPTGGHMLVVIGRSTNGHYICHDPFGSLLDDYTSDPNQGNGVTYPRSILDRRWLYEGKRSGWGRLFYGNAASIEADLIVKRPKASQINAAGLALIKEFEGLQLEAYLCPAGVPTIGYGSTEGVHLGDQITEATAEALLKEELRRFEATVSQAVQVPLTSNQFSALVCFAYNVGTEAFGSSTLLQVLNQGDYDAAAQELLRWNKAAGEVLPGLVRRRAAEQQLFLSDV